jgi:hypothetical protein
MGGCPPRRVTERRTPAPNLNLVGLGPSRRAHPGDVAHITPTTIHPSREPTCHIRADIELREARPYEQASPGEYRLRSTSEVVIDPDFITTWTVTQGKDS